MDHALQHEIPEADATAMPQAAWCANPIIEWLLTEAWSIAQPGELIAAFGARLVTEGVPLMRLMCFIRTLHPQVIGTRYEWRRERGTTEEFEPPHHVTESRQYTESPMAALFEDGAAAIRRRLDAGAEIDYPILAELAAEGITDYVALPLIFSDGTINAITFSADRAGGFHTAELEVVYDSIAVLARLIETHTLRRTARTLVETYVGRQAGSRVLDGLVKLGDGERIHAVIWFCDLRDSTALAETLPMEEFLGLLNDFFACMAGAVMDHGGEVLRFIGDAALAIFAIDGADHPLGQACTPLEGTCMRSLDAARDARARLERVNLKRQGRGQEPIGYGLALHVGDVMYGNIGVPERLEFTVIGSAANEAARIEGLSRELGHDILISSEFERCFGNQIVSLGHHQLRGVGQAQEIFTLSDPGLAP